MILYRMLANVFDLSILIQVLHYVFTLLKKTHVNE